MQTGAPLSSAVPCRADARLLLATGRHLGHLAGLSQVCGAPAASGCVKEGERDEAGWWPGVSAVCAFPLLFGKTEPPEVTSDGPVSLAAGPPVRQPQRG